MQIDYISRGKIALISSYALEQDLGRGKPFFICSCLKMAELTVAFTRVSLFFCFAMSVFVSN